MLNCDSPHPDTDELTSFALGLLREEELARVASHLETCATCLESIDTTTVDKFVDLVRSVDDPLQRSAPSRRHAGYEIIEPIGQGGMGVVYRARQIGLGRIVALKRMRYAELGSADDLARFRAEAEVMARLHHPNIVQVFEVGEQDGSPFLACEFVPGKGLDCFLRSTPLPVRSAAQLVATLARAADVAHQHSIVHRDLKPSNVLISWPYTSILPEAGDDFWAQAIPKIADFGLAKRLDVAERRTHTNALLGTPEYMAPEQAGGQLRLVGPATDIHALGAILYEALTGRRPFQGSDVGDTLRLVREVIPTSPRRLCPKLPRELEIICLKCLEKDPSRRYVSAEALADDLEAWLAGRTITAKPPTAWERSSKWVQRNAARAIAFLLALTLVAGTALGVVAHVWRLRKEADRANAAETRALDSAHRGYEAIDRLIQEWSRDAPNTLAWRDRDSQLKDQALVFLYGALGDSEAGGDAATPRNQLTRGMLLTYAGSVQQTLQRYELARRDLLRAAEELQLLMDDPELAAAARNHQANCRYNLGLTLSGLNQYVEAESQLEQSIALLSSKEADDHDVLELGRFAMRHEAIGNVRLARGQPERALLAYRTALELRRRIYTQTPHQLASRVRFADDCRLVAVSVAMLPNGFDEADRVLSEAEAKLQLGFEDHPPLEVAKGLARLAAGRASLAVSRGSVDQGLAYQDRGIELAMLALAEEPGDIDAKGWVHSLQRSKAYTLSRVGRYDESLPHWEQAIRFADANEKAFCQIERALERALVGKHRQATGEAAEIVGAGDPQARTLLHAARVYSRALEAVQQDPSLDETERSRTISEYGQRGLECLERSTQRAAREPTSAAATPPVDTDSDPALAALRSTDGFRAWRSAR